MSEYADLEIGLHRREAGSYLIDFRFSHPDSETDIRLDPEAAIETSLDLEALRGQSHDAEAYSRALTQAFFAAPAFSAAFSQARTSAQTMRVPLRVRLAIGPSAPELHGIYWETLRDPQDGSLLSTNENLPFSRYLSSADWRPVRLRSREELRVLAMVANPSNLGEYDLAVVDRKSELERVRKGLGEIAVCALPEDGSAGHATLNALIDEIREKPYDIFYLVCHGTVAKEEPWLWLEDDDGKASRTSGTELVNRLKGLETLPRLVILASCESAGSRTGAALAALGPRLAKAGVPAVIAMQEKVDIETAASFTAVLFRELQRDGQIDRAVAAARAGVSRQADYFAPALFSRMKSGRIWYVPGFGEEQNEYKKWSSLAAFIKEKTCTPIIGHGVLDAIIGTRREIAIRWAEKNNFPLAPQDRDVLPRVAQYLVTHQSAGYLPLALREAMRDAVLHRYRSAMPAGLIEEESWSNEQLVEALQIAIQRFATGSIPNPFQQLAELRLPIYITTSPFDFITDALTAAGAKPVVRICRWSKSIPRDRAIYEETPTPDKPLVYHLFGHISLPNSQVFSEDQFFDYLIGVMLNKNLVPGAVRAALTNSALLFLGLQIDDWEFRTLFRYLMALEGRERLEYYSHVSAQMEPEEDRIIDVERASRYLEEYFKSERIGIYWGSSSEFLRDLWTHM